MSTTPLRCWSGVQITINRDFPSIAGRSFHLVSTVSVVALKKAKLRLWFDHHRARREQSRARYVSSSAVKRPSEKRIAPQCSGRRGKLGLTSGVLIRTTLESSVCRVDNRPLREGGPHRHGRTWLGKVGMLASDWNGSVETDTPSCQAPFEKRRKQKQSGKRKPGLRRCSAETNPAAF